MIDWDSDTWGDTVWGCLTHAEAALTAPGSPTSTATMTQGSTDRLTQGSTDLTPGRSRG